MVELFNYQFFTHALLAGILTSISCGIIGTYIVTRRIVFFSGGISHTSFGGVGIGYYFGFNPIIGAALFSVAAAIGLEVLSWGKGFRKDSLIGMMWSFGMALGIIFVSLTPGYAANLMSYLFGNILTVSAFDLALLGSITLIIFLFFYIFFKQILYISFDEEFARTRGTPTRWINLSLMVLVAVTIVINIRIVGIILIISMLTIPQATAALYARNFKRMIFLSILFALISALLGLYFSFILRIPSGAAIIFSALALFIILKVQREIQKKLATKRAVREETAIS